MGFLRDLEAAVAAAIADGQSLQQAQQSVQLSEYADWLLFDERRENLIAGAYRILTMMP